MRIPLVFPAIAVAMLQNACGVLLDGAYLVSDGRYGNDTEERRPTGSSQTGVERDLRFENGRLRLSCAEVSHSLDRVWNVHREYEYQGGIYQAHWVPIILEGMVGGITSAVVASKCVQPESDVSCRPLYYMIPLGLDVAYSAVRLATIDKPKLVDKTSSAAWTAPNPQPSASMPIACEPNSALVLGSQPADPEALRVAFDDGGYLSVQDQQRAITYLARRHDARVLLVPGGQAPSESPTNRCHLLRDALQLGHVEAASGLGPECPAPAPAR